jgi:hypothetical protein
MSLSDRYPLSLGPDQWDGEVNGISVKWTGTARNRLGPDAADLKMDAATVKALTEHYLCKATLRFGSQDLVIL